MLFTGTGCSDLLVGFVIGSAQADERDVERDLVSGINAQQDLPIIRHLVIRRFGAQAVDTPARVRILTRQIASWMRRKEGT